MPPLAQRNLFHDKVRLAVTLTGIVFSVVLIVVQLGLFSVSRQTTSNLIDHSGADLWITSKNVPYVEQGVAFSERKLNQVRAVPGVRRRAEDHRALDTVEARTTAGRSRCRLWASTSTTRWSGRGTWSRDAWRI